ncbi:MAG: alpha/beta fold hydrolase [Candidatus Zixiibacteriota bacterium]
MKIAKLSALILAIALTALCTTVHAQPKIEGAWQGIMTVPGAQLHIVFNLSRNADGTLLATMDSPDQGARGIPIDLATFENNHLHLEIKGIGGSFDGDLNADGSTLEGKWGQAGMSFPLTMARPGTAASQTATPAVEKSSSSDYADITGLWIGTLAASGLELRLIVHLNVDSTGKLTASFDSPDQGPKNIPFDSATFAAGHVRLTSTNNGAVYNADLSADKATLSGTWAQSGMTFPLGLKKTDKAPEVNRPQEPKEPFPYDQREVSYENKEAAITIAGTLTIPRTQGPHPAVLLITGSGPQDRDESLMEHRPFAVLADYLTRRGIAVLRCDDRGIGKSTGKFATATTRDFADDAAAGVAFLKADKDIDPNRIGLIGHSEGGIIAPMVASESRDVSFIVLMAGTGESGVKILLDQSAMIARASGISEEVIELDAKIKRQVFSLASNDTDSATAVKEIFEAVAKSMTSVPDSLQAALDYTPHSMSASVNQLLSPWFRYFLRYDPVPALEKVHCPVLAINGEKDMQVPPKENLAAIEQALKKGGNKDYTAKELAGLNHLFQTAPTGAPSEYGKIEETISPIALATIGDWIVAHTEARK